MKTVITERGDLGAKLDAAARLHGLRDDSRTIDVAACDTDQEAEQQSRQAAFHLQTHRHSAVKIHEDQSFLKNSSL